MRSTSGPALVPAPHFDVTVYLVLDDFGPIGRAYLETTRRNATERPSSGGYSPANTKSPSELLRSTPPKAGRKTSRRRSRGKCLSARRGAESPYRTQRIILWRLRSAKKRRSSRRTHYRVELTLIVRRRTPAVTRADAKACGGASNRSPYFIR